MNRSDLTPGPDFEFLPDGVRVTVPTPEGDPATVFLEPWQALALGQAARERWGERNEGDERVEDQGRRGVL